MSLVNDVLKDLSQRNHPFVEANLSTTDFTGTALIEPPQRNSDLIAAPTTRHLTKRDWLGSKTRVNLALILMGFAIVGTDLHRVVRATGTNESLTANLPRYVKPSRMAVTSLDTNSEKTEKIIPDDTIKLVASVPQNRKPSTRVSEDQPITPRIAQSENTSKNKIVKNKAPESAPEMNDSAFLEVIHRPLSAEQQLLNEFHVAANLFKIGDSAKAERLLQDLLAQDGTQHQARVLLARIYLHQKLDDRAELVLSNGLLRYPQQVSYVSLYAQILVGQGRDNAAIDLLQKALPIAADNARFHALLAGIYQRTGNSAQAANMYLTALQIDPTHGEWWMGLGISSEQAGDGAAAENAYAEALLHPIARDIEQYIQQRLQKLTAKKAASKSQTKK